MKALLISINHKGGVCCTFIVIDVEVVMDMVNYSTIKNKRSVQKDQRTKGSMAQNKINGVEKYDTNYGA